MLPVMRALSSYIRRLIKARRLMADAPRRQGGGKGEQLDKRKRGPARRRPQTRSLAPIAW